MRSLLKKIAVASLLILIIIQFIRPAKNSHAINSSKQISVVVNVPDNVNLILKKACYDCHSNNTNLLNKRLINSICICGCLCY